MTPTKLLELLKVIVRSVKSTNPSRVRSVATYPITKLLASLNTEFISYLREIKVKVKL